MWPGSVCLPEVLETITVLATCDLGLRSVCLGMVFKQRCLRDCCEWDEAVLC